MNKLQSSTRDCVLSVARRTGLDYKDAANAVLAAFRQAFNDFAGDCSKSTTLEVVLGVHFVLRNSRWAWVDCGHTNTIRTGIWRTAYRENDKTTGGVACTCVTAMTSAQLRRLYRRYSVHHSAAYVTLGPLVQRKGFVRNLLLKDSFSLYRGSVCCATTTPGVRGLLGLQHVVVSCRCYHAATEYTQR